LVEESLCALEFTLLIAIWGVFLVRSSIFCRWEERYASAEMQQNAQRGGAQTKEHSPPSLSWHNQTHSKTCSQYQAIVLFGR